MPLWESNEIYFVAGLSVLVTLGVFASVAYFVYRRAVANGRRADEEQAALEKVLLRKEAITTSPPTKPLIVSPSFSSPNKVPARHLRSGSYSPTHYLSPYHSRQPRRNSSPTSPNISSVQQPKLPNLQLHHPQLQLNQNDYHLYHHHHHHHYPHAQHKLQGTSVSEVEDEVNSESTSSGVESTSSASPSPSSSSSLSVANPTGNSGSKNEMNSAYCVPIMKTNNNSLEPESVENNVNGNRNNVPGSLAHHNSQYYGTIPPRRFGGGRHGHKASVAPAESNLAASSNVSAFLPLKCGAAITSSAVIVPHLKQKNEYAQLPGKDGVDFHDEGNWRNKDEIGDTSEKRANKKWKNRSPPYKEDGSAEMLDVEDVSLRRKLLLQKQHQQKLQMQKQQQHLRLSNEPPGELFKMKHTVTEEIPYYISTQ